MLFNKSFVLASTSKSRYYMLKNIGLKFSKKKPTCNEEEKKKELIRVKTTAKKISLELARLKAKSISDVLKNKLVVGSDSIIQLGNKNLNKAKNKKEAERKIILLSGKKHFIYSSASVFFNGKEVWNSTQKTIVKIRKINQKEVKRYVLKEGKDILGSVGCYQLEKRGPNIIEDISGDFFNVMGFPLFPFLKFLKKVKIKT